MRLFELLKDINKSCQFTSRKSKDKDGLRPASGSELMDWIKQGSVVINGEISKDPKEEMDFPIISFRLFRDAKTITLY